MNILGENRRIPMARIFDIEPTKYDDSLIMAFIQVRHLTADYKECQAGYAVNDGKYLTYIDDNEVYE